MPGSWGEGHLMKIPLIVEDRILGDTVSVDNGLDSNCGWLTVSQTHVRRGCGSWPKRALGCEKGVVHDGMVCQT